MWTDIYVLAFARSREVIELFKKHWLLGMTESAADYWFPYFADADEATKIFQDAESLIECLLLEPSEPYAIYWTNRQDANSKIKGAMMFFTKDGELIVGLSVASAFYYENGLVAGSIPFVEDKILLEQLSQTVDAKFGYMTIEEPSADTKDEFICEVMQSTYPQLVDGIVS